MSPTHIYAPDGTVGGAPSVLAAAPATLSGQRLVALDNGKPGADLLLGETGRHVARRTGATFLGVQRKGSAATPCEPDLLAALQAEADLILTGTAD